MSDDTDGLLDSIHVEMVDFKTEMIKHMELIDNRLGGIEEQHGDIGEQLGDIVSLLNKKKIKLASLFVCGAFADLLRNRPRRMPDNSF